MHKRPRSLHRYLEDNNVKLETAYKEKLSSTNVQVGKRNFLVTFNNGTYFATQRDGYKCRVVRRTIGTRRVLKKMINELQPLANYAADSVDLSENLKNLSMDDVASFVCPITRQVMKDPVLTPDGHTYERTAIEEWCRAC